MKINREQFLAAALLLAGNGCSKSAEPQGSDSASMVDGISPDSAAKSKTTTVKGTALPPKTSAPKTGPAAEGAGYPAGPAAEAAVVPPAKEAALPAPAKETAVAPPLARPPILKPIPR